MIDTTGPSAPTVMKAVKGGWTIVNLSQWQNVDIYFPLVTPSGEALVTGSVDNESGILKYQISADKVTWYDLGAYTATGVYVTSGTTTRYYRAINNAGVAGAVASINVYIDKIAPTISYNYNAQSLTNWYNGAYYMGFFSSGITPTLTLTDTGGSGLSSNNQVSIWKDGTWVNNAVSIGNNQWSIPMLKDGRWIPHIIARDNAGNISVGTRSDGNHLTVWDVDTTKPTVSYSVAGGSYDTAQTVRVTANDTNYSYMKVRVYNNAAETYTNYIAAKSNDNITANYFDVALDSDGSWTIYTQVYDKAGNKQNQSPNNGTWYYQTYTINTGAKCEQECISNNSPDTCSSSCSNAGQGKDSCIDSCIAVRTKALESCMMGCGTTSDLTITHSGNHPITVKITANGNEVFSETMSATTTRTISIKVGAEMNISFVGSSLATNVTSSLETINITGANFNSSTDYTFTMPSSDVNISFTTKVLSGGSSGGSSCADSFAQCNANCASNGGASSCYNSCANSYACCNGNCEEQVVKIMEAL